LRQPRLCQPDYIVAEVGHMGGDNAVGAILVVLLVDVVDGKREAD